MGRIDRDRGVENGPRAAIRGRDIRMHRERELADLARRQQGAVGRDQLFALGFTRDAIRHRLQTRRLRQVHRGVYAVGSQPLSQRGRWFAALLATRPLPLLSHLSSAAIRGLAREAALIHVTTASRSTRNLTGVTVHRARDIHPADRTRIDGLPVTTLPRTLLDLAETLPANRFEAILEEADRRELLDLHDLHATAERNRGRRGLRRYLALVERFVSTSAANEGIEREFQLLLNEESLPLPELNVLVAGHTVDCYWPVSGFVVELDSREHHRSWAARERDLVRDADLLRAGIPSMRVTSRRMREERAQLMADIRARTT